MRQRTRVTSYSLRNSVDLPSPSLSGPGVSPNDASKFRARGQSGHSPTISSLSFSSVSQIQTTSTSSTAVASPNTTTHKPDVVSPPPQSSTSTSAVSATKYQPPLLLRTSTATATARLSRLLSSAALPTPAPTPETSSAAGANDTTDLNTTNFAAFKALPIDRAWREGSGSAFEPAAPDDLAGVSTCKEAVDLMVDAIASACSDAHAHAHAHAHSHDSAMSDMGKNKSDGVPLVLNEDIVGSVSFFFSAFHSAHLAFVSLVR
jgi:hypothetical protein